MSGLHAVVLAAGAGERFGGGKLTAAFRGRTLIDFALDAALAAPVETVVLVTGADAEAVRAALAGRDEPRLRLVHAETHAEGMGASLRTGIAALPAEASGVLVFLGDMPAAPAAAASAVAQALAGGACAAAPVFEGRRGHPAGLARRLFPHLLALRGDEGARAVLASLGERLVEIVVKDAGVVTDVDTREALDALG